MFYKDARLVYRSPILDEFEWLDHGFGTRLSETWPPHPYAWVKQVHSDRCIVADGIPGCLAEADALITASPGCYLTIRTADCIPVLLADTRRRAIAAVHAGWRGTVQHIVIRAIDAMRRNFDTKVEDLAAAIGPGICAECYEVGPEVAAQFHAWFPERTDLDSRAKIDLAEANRRQLVSAGVPERLVSVGALCTAMNPKEFHSWRRDHVKTGRMTSAIAIRP